MEMYTIDFVVVIGVAGRATTRCVSRFSLSSKQSSMESFPQTLLSAWRVVVFFIDSHRTWLQSLQDLSNRHFFPSASSRFYLILKLSIYCAVFQQKGSSEANSHILDGFTRPTCECATSPQEIKHHLSRAAIRG